MAKKISKSRSKIIKNAISIPKEKIKILRKEKPKIFSIFETINQWLKENCEDCPPTIVHDYCVSGHKNKVTEAKITGFLNHLFSQKLTSYKVGKTCQAETRITKKDYKGVYSKMYILYKSTKPEYVSAYESHYINHFFDKLDNTSKVSNGRNCSIANYYYVYVVVR